jgi:EPS-associated MarR family transcriptional regulator
MPSSLDIRRADVTFRVMRLLEAKPEITQRDLALSVGVSLGALNYCLRALVGKGLVKIQNFGDSSNKLGYVYVLTPRGLKAKAEMTGSFLKRKVAEYEALRAEIESLRSGLEPPTVPSASRSQAQGLDEPAR